MENSDKVEICDINYLGKKVTELRAYAEGGKMRAQGVLGYCDLFDSIVGRFKSLLLDEVEAVDLSTVDYGLINRYECPYCNKLQVMCKR